MAGAVRRGPGRGRNAGVQRRARRLRGAAGRGLPANRDLVRDYSRALRELGGRCGGERRCSNLPEGMTDADHTPEVAAPARRDHAARVPPPPGSSRPPTPVRRGRCPWPDRGHVDAARGFDERYVGYGGEDTDFGQRIAAVGGDRGGGVAQRPTTSTTRRSHPRRSSRAIARNAASSAGRGASAPTRVAAARAGAAGHLRCAGE
ncbi:galactosyltransferase-related protein [Kocuria rhizophila]|nr:galactosyltransferase-related protein [Kocuria rhizophila]